MTGIHLAGDAAADDLLTNDAFALLVGMLLDQQIPIEKAFMGPYVIRERLDGRFDAATIADTDPEAFAEVMTRRPAVHRFPGAMAKRVQQLARDVVDDYDGDPTAIWSTGGASEVRERVEALPGFGAQKARIFLALLGKQRGVRPRGWRAEAEPYGAAGTYLSVADITDATSLARVREAKRAAKARAKTEPAEPTARTAKTGRAAGDATTAEAGSEAGLRPEVRRRLAKDSKLQRPAPNR